MKFHFTALLSDVLRELALRARSESLQKAALRRVPIHDLLEMMQCATSWRVFADKVLGFEGGGQWVSRGLRLPDVIWDAGDLDLMVEPLHRPTFVGSTVVRGRPHVVEKGSLVERGELMGAVVGAETADPGYDWLFAHRFAGLVTAYGGEFSHIGLRCGEFGIPAVLGCGPAVFGVAVAAQELRLDPVNGELWADGRRIVPA